ARLALRPLVADFIEKVLPGHGNELGLEDIEEPVDSLLVGRTVAEAQRYSGGASVLAIRKSGRETLPKPSDGTVIEIGDRLILLGEREQLRMLEGTK
ncbi:MAG: cation:proton antiporter regulatory subunit, partial [Chloroflexota bacterium]